jgi:hypothetical protein
MFGQPLSILKFAAGIAPEVTFYDGENAGGGPWGVADGGNRLNRNGLLSA